MNLPTREQINVHDSLDERSACQTFLGKTLAEAEALFRENWLHYQEDLMWMGPVAFRFYVFAFVRYLKSPEADRNADAINGFANLLEFRQQYEPQELRPIASELIAACRYILDTYERFEVDPDFYGDLLSRYQQLIQKLSQ